MSEQPETKALERRIEDALLQARCQIGAFKRAHLEIAQLDPWDDNSGNVGRILSRLRDEVGQDFTEKVRRALAGVSDE